MSTEVRNKLFGWLAGLILYPVMGWGQVILEHPQDATVCVGESAIFTAQATLSNPRDLFLWIIDGVRSAQLPSEKQNLIEFINDIAGIDRQVVAIFSYNEVFNGITVKCALITGDNLVTGEDRLVIYSSLAYLSYEPSQQFPVINLTATVTNTTAQLDWDTHTSNFTNQYLFGVYDGDNNLVANQTTNTSHINFNLPPMMNDTCQYLEFRVTADQCPAPDSRGFVQNEAATFVHREPDIDLSPVTAELDNNQAVLVNWTPDGDDTFWIVVTDLESGEQSQTTHGTPPYTYTEKACGKWNIAVSPAQCADEPGFTHSTNISIDCPTSGTQASYPSWLLAVAAIIPLLKWQH